MFNIFGKHEIKHSYLTASDGNHIDHAGSSERRDGFKRILGTPQVGGPQNGHKPTPAAVTRNNGPLPFEEIYRSAAVPPPQLDYGIAKVAEMAASRHLAGMPTEFKRNALLMALEAANTNVGDVLNDVVIRQRALADYEETLQEKMKLFDAEQSERNRIEQQELDRITSQQMARIQSNLDEVARAHEELRAWQKSKQQESLRLTEAAALCVSQDKPEEDDGDNVLSIPQRATGTFR